MYCDRLKIRTTGPDDEAGIGRIVQEAFGRTDEAELALDLIKGPERTLSLIGEYEGRPVGHILLSEVSGPVRSVALATLGVVPAARELQVGSHLVRDAVARCRKRRYEAIFVLGDPAYYERFGFDAMIAKPFDAPWPGKRFMALELHDGALSGHSGKLTYPPRFFA